MQSSTTEELFLSIVRYIQAQEERDICLNNAEASIRSLSALQSKYTAIVEQRDIMIADHIFTTTRSDECIARLQQPRLDEPHVLAADLYECRATLKEFSRIKREQRVAGAHELALDVRSSWLSSQVQDHMTSAREAAAICIALQDDLSAKLHGVSMASYPWPSAIYSVL